MAPSALDVGEHTLEPIEHWLDGIKAGFAEKFYWLFSGMGIEDTEDLRLMKAHRVAAMREDLVLEGCKPVTLDRLMDAVKAARRPPRRPGRRKKKVRQSNRDARGAARDPEEPSIHVPVAPPVVVQRGATGWEAADEERQKRLDRLVRRRSLPEQPRAPSPRTLVVEKGDGGNWAFRVDEDRAKIWERMMHSPRAARGPEPPPEPARPASAGPTRRLHVEKVRGAWTWHLDDSRKKRPQRRGDELASPRRDRRPSKSYGEDTAAGVRSDLKGKPRVSADDKPRVSADDVGRRWKEGAGLYKPLRVNGVHVDALAEEEREEQERLNSNRKNHRLSEAVKRQRAWIEKKARKGADHGGIHFAAMKGHDLPGEDEKAKTPEGTPRSPPSAARSLRSAADDDDAEEEEEAEDLFAGLSSIARSVARS
ncbi:hypothetical protein JL721_6567 [Aureococcus anophagefferens]|nr:hypothetical protein JL721_6567 [Aureococcus anophagefferens]